MDSNWVGSSILQEHLRHQMGEVNSETSILNEGQKNESNDLFYYTRLIKKELHCQIESLLVQCSIGIIIIIRMLFAKNICRAYTRRTTLLTFDKLRQLPFLSLQQRNVFMCNTVCPKNNIESTQISLTSAQLPDQSQLKDHFSSLDSQQSPITRKTFHEPEKLPKLEDELLNYQQYLAKHNNKLKKPHLKLVEEEKRIINAYLQAGKHHQILQFLHSNKKHQLCSPSTASEIDQYFVTNPSAIAPEEHVKLALALSCFGQYRFYKLISKTWQKTLFPEQSIQKELNDTSLNISELILFFYNTVVMSKGLLKYFSTKSFKSLAQKHQQNVLNFPSNVYSYAESCLKHLKSRSEEVPHFLQQQYNQLVQYLSMFCTKSFIVYEKEENNIKKRSLLEKQIQCFLKVLNYENAREVTINSFVVDFMLKKITVLSSESKPTDEIILEVNGAYHYTINGALKPSEVIKLLTLNLYRRVKIIHCVDYNKTKGYRNKIQYIKSVLELKQTNWAPQGSGFDSFWQLDETYSEFK